MIQNHVHANLSFLLLKFKIPTVAFKKGREKKVGKKKDRLALPFLSFFLSHITMRPLTSEETTTLFQKLAK